MPLVKICPSCKRENNIGITMCDFCMTDISGVSPTDNEAKNQVIKKEPQNVLTTNDASSTVIEREKSLWFVASDGSGSFSIRSNSIIGREAEGKEYLLSHRTVSRRHAKVTYNGTWNIEDLNSANGTYVNERKLEKGEKVEIKKGDSVALSHSCVFNIIE